MQPTDTIKQLFTDYARAFDKLDFNTQARFFADTFMMAGPAGAVSKNKAEFLRKADKAATFYKSVGQTSARLLSMDEKPISPDYVIVKTHWGVTFQKTGNNPVEFDVSYIVHKKHGGPEIILAISHEDEQKAMQKLGLLQQA
jgi:ketosteroid isomerase-like protein